jgi:zinc transporter
MNDHDRGLVCGYEIDHSGRAREIGWDEVKRRPPGEGLLWLHLDRSDAHTRSWLTDNCGLDPLVVEALLADETRPRSMAFDSGLLLIMRGVNFNPGADPEDMVSIRIWVEPNLVISCRQRRVAAVQDIRDAIAHGRVPRNEGDLVVSLAGTLMQRASTVIEDLEDAVDELEEQLLEAESREVRFRLHILRRQAIALRRHLSPQRDALARLVTEEQPWLQPVHRSRVREIADRVTRYVEDLDEVRERAAVVQDELMNQLSERMNKTVYLLTVVATIMLPLGFLTGLLGINVGGIPGAEIGWAFWAVCGSLAAVVAIEIWIFKRLKWL